MKELKVKRWVIDKAQQTAGRYNTYIDFARRNEEGRPLEENGFVFVFIEEVLGETEKAIHVRLFSGQIVGFYKGWSLWVPKSQIA